MLRSELRDDFRRNGVRAFGVAFPASEVILLAPSILHAKPTERLCIPVIAIEAHAADTHLQSHREITGVRLAVLAPIASTGPMQIGDLL
jgi:hypothetical protein